MVGVGLDLCNVLSNNHKSSDICNAFPIVACHVCLCVCVVCEFVYVLVGVMSSYLTQRLMVYVMCIYICGLPW